MGLDIYLYKYADFENTRMKEKQYEKYSDSLWKGRPYANISNEEREEIKKKELEFKISLGIDNEASLYEKIESPSLIHPNHMFQVGYFRSSYNDGGINRILETICKKSLSDVFQNLNDEMYYVKPNWENALRVVDDLITKLSNHMKEINVTISAIDMPATTSEKLPTSTSEALVLYIEEFLREKLPFDGAYSNSVGLFSLKSSQRVKAFIPGIKYNRPCIFIVHEAEGLHWYIEALEIVKETIEYVLAQPDREKYYLHWSG